MDVLRRTTERWYAGPVTENHEESFRRRREEIRVLLSQFDASSSQKQKNEQHSTQYDGCDMSDDIMDEGSYRRGLARRITCLHGEPTGPHPMGDSGLRISFLTP